MANWNSVSFKKEDIIKEDSNSILVKLPSNINDKNYVGYMFNHRLKMIKKNNDEVVISFPKDWNFVFIKEDISGKVIDQKEIKVSEFYKIV